MESTRYKRALGEFNHATFFYSMLDVLIFLVFLIIR